MSKIIIPSEIFDDIKRKTSCLNAVVSNRELIEDPLGFRLAQLYAMELVDLFESTGIRIKATDLPYKEFTPDTERLNDGKSE